MREVGTALGRIASSSDLARHAYLRDRFGAGSVTLIGTWIALASPVRASGAVQAVAAVNLLLLVVGLSLLTLAWCPEAGPVFAIAWALLVAIVLLLYTAVFSARSSRH